jgi:hypothetical protein
MKTIETDARRYAWCHGHAVWRMGMPVAALLEDAHGALDAGQHGLVHRNARVLGQSCAVVLALVVRSACPLPAQPMRASWALGHLGDHPLAAECRALIRGEHTGSPAELVDRCERLVEAVRGHVGQVPDPLTPEGYFPSLATAREWLTLAEAVGAEGFLPLEWTRKG